MLTVVFLSDIYPKLCDAMKKSCTDLTVINDNIYASLDMGEQHPESTIDNSVPASNLNTTKLVSMPIWNDKDDRITSSTVPAIEYVDQTVQDEL